MRYEDIVFLIPSGGRPNGVKTLKTLAPLVERSQVALLVAPEEIPSYEHYGLRIVPGARGMEGNLNCALSALPEGTPVVSIDDDATRIVRWHSSPYRKFGSVEDITRSEFQDMVELGFDVQDAYEAAWWGVNYVNDPMMMAGACDRGTAKIGLASSVVQLWGYLSKDVEEMRTHQIKFFIDVARGCQAFDRGRPMVRLNEYSIKAAFTTASKKGVIPELLCSEASYLDAHYPGWLKHNHMKKGICWPTVKPKMWRYV